MFSFSTPRRQHSSLFQRMQEQITKISKKLSLAKQYYTKRQTTPTKLKPQEYPSNRTVKRRNHSNFQLFQNSSVKLTENTLRKKPYQPYLIRQNRHLSKVEPSDLIIQNQQMNELMKQNFNLTKKLKVVENICSEQSYRIGFLKAQNMDVKKKIFQGEEERDVQNIYFERLVQGYQNKVARYEQRKKLF